MKILHFDLDDLENPLGGGQCVRTREINKRLAQKGHQITVITSRYKGSKNKSVDGINYKRIGFATGPMRYISFFLLIPWYIWTTKKDLIIEDTVPPFTLALSPLYTRRPIISILQSFHAKHASDVHHFPFWMFEKYGSRLYKNFIVLTENMKTKIAKLNKKANIAVIPNGLNEIPAAAPASSVTSAAPARKNYLLFLGRIDYHEKGIDALLEIMKIVHAKIPGLKLVIAGDGKDREKLQRILYESACDYINYIGKITGEEKEKLIRECFAMVQPSRFETFSLTTLEGAAYGKPTVSFGIENLEYINQYELGFRVNMDDHQAFAEKIADLYENKDLYERLSHNARSWAKKHRWDDLAEEQEKLYKSVLKASRAI